MNRTPSLAAKREDMNTTTDCLDLQSIELGVATVVGIVVGKIAMVAVVVADMLAVVVVDENGATVGKVVEDVEAKGVERVVKTFEEVVEEVVRIVETAEVAVEYVIATVA